jgi:hypothetical protein
MHPRNGVQTSSFCGFIGAVALFTVCFLTGCAAMHSTPYLSYLTVTPNSTSVALGETAQLKVEATYSNGTTEDVTKSATWHTMNSDVATVNASGIVSSVAVGTTFVFASTSGVSGAASLSVSKAALASISISAPAAPIVLGQSAQLQASGTYTDKSVQDITDLVTWSAAQPNVIKLSATGLAASEAAGNTGVTASLNNISASSQISVSPAALVSITVRSKDVVAPLGASEQFAATGTYTDGSTADLTSVASWTSSAPGVISINAMGTAATRAVGNASITAGFSGISGVTTFTVSSAALVSIAVSASHASLPLGGTEQLTATGTYTDGSTRDLTASATWTSSSPGVVAVAGGAITTKAVGAAAVTASSSSITGSANLSVSSAALVSIAVSAVKASLPLGGTEQLIATGTYTDGSSKDLTASATWTSSAPGVVAVASNGAVTTKSVGAAVVVASSSSITGSANLSVSSAALVSIAVSASHASLPLGGTEQLIATGTYTDGSSKDLTGSATWTSSAPGVVAVASNGAVTTRSVGTAAVSASSSSITGSANLSVSSAALISIAISSGNAVIPVGDTLQLSAMGTLTDGSTQDMTGSVNWTSSAPGVISVKSSGLAAGVAVGSAGVTASSGSISGVASLSVSAPVLTSISLSPAGPTVPLGSTLQLSVTGTFSDGSTQDVTSQVTWSIATPAIASITGGGVASGQQVGTTGVEALLNGVQTSDTLTVQPLLTVSYFDATSGIDSTIRVTNPGMTGQDLCAMVYVFDRDQQMSECCGCLISQDGLLTLSLNKNLLNNPLTGVPSKSGTVMLVSADYTSNLSCNASAATPAGTVIAWSTHLPQSPSGQMSSAEVPFSNSVLSNTLSTALQAQCSFIQQLGSGQGLCSCGSGAY